MEDRRSITFRFELIRAITAGILETGNQTFLVLIALSLYHASPTEKGVVAAGVSLGLLFTPALVRLLPLIHLPVSHVAAAISAIGGVSFLIGALSTGSFLFALTSAIGLGCYSINTPISTHIYTENYPVTERGRLFSRTLVVRIFTGMVFAVGAGWLLNGALERAPYLIAIYGGALLVAAVCYSKIPSTVLTASPEKGFFGSFKLIFDDRVFGQTLLCWMILGFGNFIMMPLRVQYLTELKLSAFEIGALVSVIPSASRMIFSPIWGRFFDRMNFSAVRTSANLCFIVSTLSFFTGQGLFGIALGSVAYGIANAGGEISWNLWVTKLAPRARASEYMSIHTCLTGIRGVVAPFIGFHLAASYSIDQVMYLSIALLVFSTLIFLPGRKALDNRMGANQG